MPIDRNNMHNVLYTLQVLKKTNAVETQMIGFNEMTHIDIKRKLFS